MLTPALSFTGKNLIVGVSAQARSNNKNREARRDFQGVLLEEDVGHTVAVARTITMRLRAVLQA